MDGERTQARDGLQGGDYRAHNVGAALVISRQGASASSSLARQLVGRQRLVRRA